MNIFGKNILATNNNRLGSRTKFFSKTNEKFIFCLFCYTICWIVLAIGIYSIFFLEKKSLVWIPDGLQQHFNSLVYYRRWIRGIIKTLITTGKLVVPMWDMNIGMGSDIITTLHYYVIGDPLNLLSVFVPYESMMEYFYAFLILFRIYLSGIAFMAYCRYHNQKPFPSLMGSLMYCFCFWAIVSVRHPYFINPMIYFPLILLGADRLFEKKRPALYISMLAITVISNFYFAYMICIFVMIYVVLSYLMRYKCIKFKQLYPWVLRFAGYSLLAIALAAFIFIPVAMVTFSTGRASAQNYLPTFYPLNYYLNLIASFMMGGTSYWSDLGYTGLGILTISMLFLSTKRYRAMKIAFATITLFLLVPFAGHILNGGSYVVNRYIWAYSMLICFVAVKMYPMMLELSEKKRIALGFIGFLYVAACAIVWDVTSMNSIPFAMLMFVALLFLILFISTESKKTFAFKLVFLSVVMCQLLYQGWSEYSPNMNDYVSDFANSGEPLDMLRTNSLGSLLVNQSDIETQRYEADASKEWKNSAMQVGLNGVSYYFSLANPYINDFQRELYVNQSRDYCYDGFDGRTFLDLLSGVKYYVIQDYHVKYLPYGFTDFIELQLHLNKKGDTVSYASYMNEHALPLVFETSDVIDRDDYDDMTVAQRQQALMQGVVVDSEDLSFTSDSISSVTPEFLDQSLDYTITCGEGVTMDGDNVVVFENGGKVTLNYEGLGHSEIYLMLEGISYDDQSDGTTRGNTRVSISARCAGVSKTFSYLTPRDNFYSGIDDCMLNLGYHRGVTHKITITFRRAGVFSFDNVEVIAQPMRDTNGWISEFYDKRVENIAFTPNTITFDSNSKKDRLAFIAVPYSTGWTCTIDGKPADIINADTMYMAVEVPSGNHKIKLVFETPYLDKSIGISLLGVATCAGLVINSRIRRRRKKV